MSSKKIFLTIGGLGALALLAGGAKEVTDIVIEKTQGIEKLKEAAKAVSSESGIPLALIVTQAAHESNYGRSGLATKSNNLFGIKAGKAWTGPVDLWDTWEVVAGKEVKVKAPFRKYASWADSVRDWAKLIRTRYAGAYLSAVAGDARGFFNGLQQGGYATDPNYATKLVGVQQSLEALI